MLTEGQSRRLVHVVFFALIFPIFVQAMGPIGGATDPGIRSVDRSVRTRHDEVTGSLVHSVDIKVPPGRNGLEPDLRFTYDSNNSDIANWFGFGWAINIPYIERINKRGTDKLYSTTTPNHFFSSLSGELATTTSSTAFAAKNDDGSFVKYTFSNDIWTAIDKMGNVYKFGYTTASRQDNPNDSSQIYKWMLTETRDANNNYIKYEYTKDRGQIYPSRITYTGNGTTDGQFEVEFAIESRADVATSSATAFPVITRYKVSEIMVEINNSWVRKYSLAYATSSSGVRSVLNTITESGQDEFSNVITLPVDDFDYATTTPGWTTSASWSMPNLDYINAGTHVIDLNGDGLTDAIQSDGTLNIAYLNDGDGTWTEDSNWDAPVNLDFIQNYGVGLVDLNGDGLVDVYKKWNTTNQVWLNNGNGWTHWTQTGWQMPDIDYQEEGSYLVDVNGDGLTDVLHARSYASVNKTYINNGDGTWTEDSGWDSPIYLDYDQTYGTGIAELNGDGLPDIYRDWGTINDVYLNNGHGWTLTPGWSMPAGDEPYGNAGYVYLDLNGDGLSDFVGARAISSSRISYINNGNGTWTEVSAWNFPSGEWLTDFGTGITDLNGDGLPDTFKKYDSNPPVNWVKLNNTKKIDLLTYAKNDTGGSSSYAYTPSP